MDHQSTAVTELIARLREDERRGTLAKLWQLYGEELTRKAQAVLRGLPDLHGNAEEAAMSAFMRFAERARHGKLNAWPTDRNSLQQMLLNAARDRAGDMKKKLLKERGRMQAVTSADEAATISEVDSRLVADEVIDALRRSLPEKVMIAGMMRFADASYEEIALAQGVGRRTIERRVAEFMDCLAGFAGDEHDAD